MRDNQIRLSDQEYSKLEDAKQAVFGTDEVPFGVVIGRLAENEITDE